MKNKYAIAHLKAVEAEGNIAQMIRKGLTSGDWEQIASGYGELLQEFGKRSRVKGSKEFTPSTPADSYNTQLQTISKAMAEQGNKKVTSKLKAALIEGEDSDRWGLVAVESKKQSKSTTKKLETIRAEHVGLFDGRTYDEKVSELEIFALAMGIKLNRAQVTEFKPKATKRPTRTVKGQDAMTTLKQANG